MKVKAKKVTVRPRRRAGWAGWLFGAALLGGAALLVKSFAGGIQYSFRKIRWLGRDGLRLRFALVYDLTNQNDIPATVSSLRGRVMYGDYRLNEIVIDQPVTVGPGGTEALEVAFSVSPGALLGEILRFVEEKAGFKKFRLVGTMRGKVGQVPFALPLNENLELGD
jgi:hypothetical protein